MGATRWPSPRPPEIADERGSKLRIGGPPRFVGRLDRQLDPSSAHRFVEGALHVVTDQAGMIAVSIGEALLAAKDLDDERGSSNAGVPQAHAASVGIHVSGRAQDLQQRAVGRWIADRFTATRIANVTRPSRERHVGPVNR